MDSPAYLKYDSYLRLNTELILNCLYIHNTKKTMTHKYRKNIEIEQIRERIKLQVADDSLTGVIIFGTLADESPFDSSTYSSWMIRSDQTNFDFNPQTKREISLTLDELIAKRAEISSMHTLHGIISIDDKEITLIWTTKDIADTKRELLIKSGCYGD